MIMENIHSPSLETISNASAVLLVKNKRIQKSHFVQTQDLVGQLKQPVTRGLFHISDVLSEMTP